ncbi:plasmid mobilization protein [Streptomyces sedi]|nr:plasmid mobilization relaxosome protein MobC [Streptomyces sedi]
MRSVRLSAAELERVTVAARASGMTTAGFLAQAAVAAARDVERAEGRIAGDREIVVELFAARRHLRQVGNNVNQVARALHSGSGLLPQTGSVLAAVETAVRRVEHAVEAVVAR